MIINIDSGNEKSTILLLNSPTFIGCANHIIFEFFGMQFQHLVMLHFEFLLMRKKRIANYYKHHGFMMSRRGREALRNNEFPISHWTERFLMPASQVEQLLIYMGIHHTGVHGNETKFYRLPDVYDTSELMSVYHAFHSVVATKLNFINIMSKHLQLRIEDRFTNIPVVSKPRKRIRLKSRKKGKRRVRKFRVI